VYFESEATNLVPGDNNNDKDIFEKNLITGAVRRIAVQAEDIDISSDGLKLAYHSWRSGTSADVALFVVDLQTGIETQVSKETDGTPLNLWSVGGSFSPDGKKVAFTHVDIQAVEDFGDFSSMKVYIKDLETGELKRGDLKADNTPFNGVSFMPKFTPDGKGLAFYSFAADMVSGSAGTVQIYLRNLESGEIKKISVNEDGDEVDGGVIFPEFIITPDSNAVIFSTTGMNLLDHDQSGVEQLFVRKIP
jgi:Tol biopolymer transport system component